MPAIAVILLLATLLLGLILLIAGLRGRRLNDHPVCKWCRFDLEGVYPESVTCPECGAGLKRDGAIRIGVRRRVPTLILVGALLAAVPLAPFGTVGWALLTGTNIDTYKPLGILLWEAHHSDRGRLDAIAGEIADRILRQKLSPDQYQRVIEEALAFQGDPSRPWSESWGDLIERARLDGVLTSSQAERFRSQAAVIDLRVRPRIQAGGTTPVLLTLKEARVGSSSNLLMSVRVKGVKVAGTTAKWDHVVDGASRFFGNSFFKDSNAVTFTLQGSRAGGGLRFMGLGGEGSGELLVEVPSDALLGDSSLQVALETSTGDGAITGGITIVNGRVRRSSSSPSATTSDAVAAADVTVVGPRDPIVTPLDATSESTQKLAEKLRPHQLTVGSAGGFFIDRGPWNEQGSGSEEASAVFNTKGIKEPIAFDVICRAGGREWKFGELDNGEKRTSSSGLGGLTFKSSMTITINGKTVTNSSSSEDGEQVGGTWEGGDARTVDIILRPSADVAARTLDLDSFYGGSIEFKDVPVVHMQGAGDPFGEMDTMLQERLRDFNRALPSPPAPRGPGPKDPSAAPRSPSSPL